MEERRNLKRRELVDKYFPFVRSIAINMGRSLPPGLEINDLINSAFIGLLISIDRYDPKKGVKFEVFARNRIRGEVIEAFRKQDKLNRKSRKLLNLYEYHKKNIENNLETSVDSETIIDKMKLEDRDKFLLRTIIDPDAALMNEFVIDPYLEVDDFIEKVDSYRFITQELKNIIIQLDERERKIIEDYYNEDEKSMREIGYNLNLSESRVSQIHSDAIKKLRKKLHKIKTLERKRQIEN